MLVERASDVAGPPEEHLLRVIYCDRCHAGVDLLVHGFPEGWTTSGDLENGFTDLCRGCSS